MDKIRLTDFKTGDAVTLQLANDFGKSAVQMGIIDFDEVELWCDPEYDWLNKEIHRDILKAMEAIDLSIPTGFTISVDTRKGELAYYNPSGETYYNNSYPRDDLKKVTGSDVRGVIATHIQAIGADDPAGAIVMQDGDMIKQAINHGVKDLHDRVGRNQLISEYKDRDPKIVRDAFIEAVENFIPAVEEQINNLDVGLARNMVLSVFKVC